MQIITFQNGFYFFGKIKDLQKFLTEAAHKYTTVQELLHSKLQ